MKKKPILILFLAATVVISMTTLFADEKPPLSTDNGGRTVGGRPIQAGQRISDFEFDLMRLTLPAPSNDPWPRNPIFDFDSKTCLEPKNHRAALDMLPVWIRNTMRDGRPQWAAKFLGTLIQFLDIKDEVISTSAALALYRLGDPGDRGYKKMRAILASDSDVKMFKDPTKAHGVSGSYDARQVILNHAFFYKDARFPEAAEALWNHQQKAGTEDLEKVDVAWYLEINGKPRPDQYWLDRLTSVELNGAYSMRGLHTTLKVLEHRKTKGAAELLEEKFRKIKEYVPKTYSEEGNVQDHRGLKKILAASLLRMTGKHKYMEYLFAHIRKKNTDNAFDCRDGEKEAFRCLLAVPTESNKHLMAMALANKNEMIREAVIAAAGEAKSPDSVALLVREATKTMQKKRFPAEELRALLTQNTSEGDAQYLALKKQLTALGHAGDFDDFEFYRIYCRDEVLPPVKPEAAPTSDKPTHPSTPPTSPGLK